jgi:hypothetical protein
LAGLSGWESAPLTTRARPASRSGRQERTYPGEIVAIALLVLGALLAFVGWRRKRAVSG